MKCAQDLSLDALERVKQLVSEYNAHAIEKKSVIKKNISKRIVKDQDWDMLHTMFNESPPVMFFNQ